MRKLVYRLIILVQDILKMFIGYAGCTVPTQLALETEQIKVVKQVALIANHKPLEMN